VEPEFEASVKHFTVTFTVYIRRCMPSVIIALQEIALQIALCGRRIEQFVCDNTESSRLGTIIVKRNIS